MKIALYTAGWACVLAGVLDFLFIATINPAAFGVGALCIAAARKE